MKSDAKSTIEAGKAILGIEFGSTRIKAVDLQCGSYLAWPARLLCRSPFQRKKAI